MDPRSPATPVTPYSASATQYKTNVNRTKTRKWVEAKVQSYDGDDWGADDGFDDDDGAEAEQQPPVPQPLRPGKLTAGLRAISQGSISSTPRSGSAGSVASLRPSERIAIEKQQAQGQRSVTGPPSLHIQTQGVQPQPPVQPAAGTGERSTPASLATTPQFPPRKSSMKSQDRPDLTVDPIMHPPRTSSRSASPASAAVRSPVSATGSTGPPKFVRPSDIYRRMEEEKDRERKSIDSARPSLDGTADNMDAVDVTARQQRRPSFGRNDSAGEGVRSLQPLAPVAERKSEYGFDGLMIKPGAPSSEEPRAANDIEPEPARQTEATPAPETKSEPEPEPEPEPIVSRQPPPPTLDHPQPTAAEFEPQPPKKRFSTSPKLPDFTRMSGFGSDFFSSAGGLLGGSPKQSEFSGDARGFAPEPTAPIAATRQSGIDAAPSTQDTTTATPSQIQREPSPPKQPKPFRPSIPGGWVSETATPGEMATPLNFSAGNVPTLYERPEDVSLKPAPLRTPTPRSGSRPVDEEDALSIRSGHSHGSPAVPHPLRTMPSPSKLSLVDRPAETSEGESHPIEERGSSSDSARTSDTNIVAPLPLQPRKSPLPDSSAEDVRHPMTRLNTDSTTGDDASPLKESDFLRDEIIRSLSPVRSADTLLGPSQDKEGATRESTYLNDVYGDYWNPEDSAPPVPEGSAVQGVDSPAAAKAEDGPASVTPTPLAHEWTSRLPPPPAAHVEDEVAAPAGSAEADKPSLKRERFSWEPAPTNTEPNKPSSPTKHPLPALPPEASEQVPSSVGVPSSAPEPTSPVNSTVLSPLISLPVLNFGGGEDETEREKGHSRVVSAVSMLPPGSDAVMEPPSPVSPNRDHDETVLSHGGDRVDGTSRALSPSEEKIVLGSPTSPKSPGSPPALESEAAHDRAESPLPPTTPTEIPLPRSPSPNKDGITAIDPDNFDMPTEKAMMSLHQIMQLPTSPERVYQMLETRAEFAAHPSGISQWQAQMLAQPEHVQGSPYFRYPPSGADVDLLGAWAARKPAHVGSGDGVGGGGGVETELTSSSVGTGLSSGGGSVRIARDGNLQLGNLMHGNVGQAGAKGKEFLHSAGKMGKGLLSKGKNKLRERAESKRG